MIIQFIRFNIDVFLKASIIQWGSAIEKQLNNSIMGGHFLFFVALLKNT